MKFYFFFLLLFLLQFISCSHNETEKTSQRQTKWELIWSDEFDEGGKPNPAKWNFAGRSSPNWACYCIDDISTSYIKDGILHLVGKICDLDSDSVKYNTGCINTRGKFFFRYGKIEVNAKLSKGQGSWPAIWMMPENSIYGSWPYSGEIDIMEHLNFDDFIYQTVHSEYIDVYQEKNNPPYSNTVKCNVDEFNTFGLEWYPDSLVFLLNDVRTFSYSRLPNASSSQWPFDQPFYIILNQALDGAWAGPVDDNHLPVSMQVDWVRVYQNNSF